MNSLTIIRLSISITAFAAIVGSSSIVLSSGCAARVVAMQGAQEHSSEEAPAQATTFATMADANKGFYSALNQMCAGNAVPMDSVWAHTTDVSDFGPDGEMHVGWEAVRAQFQKEAAMKLSGTVTCENVHSIMGDTFGVVTCIEVGKGMMVDGKPADLRFRATNVYRKDTHGWKMVHHHTDPSAPMEASASSGASITAK
jgi:ketosteroid isomerase-like protein